MASKSAQKKGAGKVAPTPTSHETTESGVKVPRSTPEVLSPMIETVSATPNKGCCIEAQPVVDSGHDCGVGHWEGDCASIKFVRGGGSDGHNDTYVGVSPRDWNITDAPAPNKEMK